MPAYRLPRDLGAHHVAAIALYRALLSQCRALTSIEARYRNELQNIVRNRFKQARHEQSTRRLRLAFEAGYEAVDHLDSAVAGDDGSKSYIVDLLSRAPEKAKQPPPFSPGNDVMKELKKRVYEHSEDNEGRSQPSLFDRPVPLEKLSGKRHVPVLYNAQGVPVLRIKKPQPESLSGYINHRLQKKQKRHDTRHRLEGEKEMAREEDRWDSIVSEHMPDDGRDDRADEAREKSWSYELAMARRELNEKLSEERRKNQVMAQMMQAVVDREQELYEKEKAQLLAGKARGASQQCGKAA